MKKFAITAALLLAAACLKAQTAPEGYEYADSLVFTKISEVDSLLAGKNIFEVLPEGVRVMQSAAIRSAAGNVSQKDRDSGVNGYRIRIFFDNSQTARSESDAALYRFKAANPGISAYRTFANPYFKVTVGDYRNRSEAMQALQAIKKDFPSAFIVRERFKFPALENSEGYKVDTVKVLRQIKR